MQGRVADGAAGADAARPGRGRLHGVQHLTMARPPSFNLGDLVRNPNFDCINHFAVAGDPHDSFNSNFDFTYNFNTPYFEISIFAATYKDTPNLKLLSLTYITEFLDLIVLLSQHNCTPDIIALQEI